LRDELPKVNETADDQPEAEGDGHKALAAHRKEPNVSSDAAAVFRRLLATALRKNWLTLLAMTSHEKGPKTLEAGCDGRSRFRTRAVVSARSIAVG
jgi:hypothetical protein